MLVDAGEKIVFLDIVATPSRTMGIMLKIKFVQGNLSNLYDVVRIAKKEKIYSPYHRAALLMVDAESDPLGF